ncbi:MAG TPA: mannose-1-phosphate guanylyltransferase/mannose-6-phosphate isomerase, partial [Kofleriaceae bacterium]|nr:mannose-1-phosphate guanylyltransferase/mannose-6-phosphate isomerase [Kofleriaceae bacterium]
RKEAALMVSNVAHRFLIDEQLEGASAEIIAEPVSRNTAPALTLAALAALARGPGDCVLVVSPSDHHVVDASAFARTLAAAVTLAERGAVVTLGITPTRAETGYGYIRRGAAVNEHVAEHVANSVPACAAFRVAQFTEKPDAATAAGFLASGEYLWNSGVFILRASRWLELIGQFAPQIERACRAALDGGRVAAGSSPAVRTVLPEPEAFAQSPSDSIDYAVMEKAVAQGGDVVVLPFTAGWSDVGDFSALAEVSELDANHNLVRGEVVTVDTKDSVLMAQQRLVAVLGMSEVVVVETGDAVLVAHRSRSQELRRMVQALKDRDRPETVHPPLANRPWGQFETLALGGSYRVKRLIVKPGEHLSLQLHHHRAEHWVVVRGRAHITRGTETFELGENQSTYIPLGVKHRIANLGTEPLEIIEVQCGTYVGEDDIVRFEDKYDRVTK